MTAEPSDLEATGQQRVAVSARQMVSAMRPVETCPNRGRMPSIGSHVEFVEPRNAAFGQSKMPLGRLDPSFAKEAVEQADRQLAGEVSVATPRERQVRSDPRQRRPSARSEIAVGQPFEQLGNVSVGESDISMPTLRLRDDQTGIEQYTDMLTYRRRRQS
jgi:hypothetical protein